VTPYSKPIESLVGDLSYVLFTNGSDPQVLADALLKLEKDRNLVKSIGEKGHLKYLENLTQKKLAQKFMEICI
jgi:glycosyltransferase involved in cell wall biosynthesis